MSKNVDGPTWDITTSFVGTELSKRVAHLKDLAPMLKVTIPIQSVYAGWEAFRRTGRMKITARLIKRLRSFISFKTFNKSSRGPLS